MLASNTEIYFTLFDFRKISLSLGPWWTALTSTYFSLARSKHSLTFPLGLGTRPKLLYHSTGLSMPRGIMVFCWWSHSNSSLKGFSSAYATCLGGTWYGLLSDFTHKENIPLKQPIPLKHLQNHFVVILWFQCLLFCHFLQWGQKKIFDFIIVDHWHKCITTI